MSLPYWHFAHNFRVLKHALDPKAAACPCRCPGRRQHPKRRSADRHGLWLHRRRHSQRLPVYIRKRTGHRLRRLSRCPGRQFFRRPAAGQGRPALYAQGRQGPHHFYQFWRRCHRFRQHIPLCLIQGSHRGPGQMPGNRKSALRDLLSPVPPALDQHRFGGRAAHPQGIQG